MSLLASLEGFQVLGEIEFESELSSLLDSAILKAREESSCLTEVTCCHISSKGFSWIDAIGGSKLTDSRQFFSC